VRAGCNHSVALTSSGRVLAWGLNVLGQVGDGTNRNRHAPVGVKLPKNTKVKAVAAGCFHSLAIRGHPLGRITSLFTGCGHSIATFSRGAVLAWGDNAYEQLGNGSTTDSDLPVPASLPAGLRSIALGGGPGTSTASSSWSRSPAERARTWPGVSRGACRR
jgi:alpha-tubulin suppressor-like RCC1 family protein